MLYEVLKEFVFVESGRIYNPGETLETQSPVRGLISKGLIKPLPKPEPEPKDECDLSEVLDGLKDYDTSDLESPKPQNLVSRDDLAPYKPEEILKTAKVKASKSVEEAQKVTKPRRKTKQKEMGVEMTSLVEEAQKVPKGR